MQNSLYRCKARVGYKFFNSPYMVVFDETQIANISMVLNWEPNFTNMNSQVNNIHLMSYATNSNTCNVSIIDPYFTGIAWPSIFDVAGQMIGSSSYLSSGVLLPPCEEGQKPGLNKCWNYEKLDIEMLYGQGNSAIKNIVEQDMNMFVAPMLFISLWYETPNGYTFGTDYLYRVMGSTVSHGNEYPMVTLSGAGNYGVVFQDRLLNVALDNKETVEKELETIAERNGFELQFCQADYETPRVLDRKVIKSNVTIRDLFNDVVRDKLQGDMMSPPTKEFLNTLHVCTRADTFQGCSVFYLGKPLYQNFKVTATADPTFVGTNISFNERSLTAIPGQRTNLSQYAPGENFLKDDSWELVRNSSKEDKEIEEVKISGDTIELVYSEETRFKGEWKGLRDDRSDYFTTSKEKTILLVEDGDKVKKEELEKKNPGLIGSWEGDQVFAVYGGTISNILDTPEKSGKIFSVKTNRVIAVRDERKLIILLEVFFRFGNVNLNPSVADNDTAKLAEILGTKDKRLLTWEFYTTVGGGEKVYLEPRLVLENSFNRVEAEKKQQEENAKISTPSTGSSKPNAGSIQNVSLDNHELFIANYLAEQGFTKEAIALMMGHMKKEATDSRTGRTLSPHARNNDGPFVGLIQWGGTRMANMPKITGDIRKDTQAQLDYMMRELRGEINSERKDVLPVLRSSTDFTTLNNAIHSYIRYNRSSDSVRLSYGREYLDKFNLTGHTPQMVSDGSDQAQSVPKGCTQEVCYGHKRFAEYTGTRVSVGNGQTLHPDAAKKFKEMQDAAKAAGVNILPVSGFRTVAAQAGLWNEPHRPADLRRRARAVAPPGYSEHATGYVIDVWDGVKDNLLKDTFASSAAYRWMQQNAKSFGFEVSFPQGNSQGVMFEPWHWRFIGTPTAKALFHGGSPGGVTTSTSQGCGSFTGFVWPMEGGWSRGVTGRHIAVDITAPVGREIYASAPGVVEAVHNKCPTYGAMEGPASQCGRPGFQGYGNIVFIDHGNGYKTLYAHLQKDGVLVKEGDRVCQCQLIGKNGSSGRSSGPHIHFEIRKGGNRVNPGQFSGNTEKCSNKGIYRASPSSATPTNGSASQPGGQSAAVAGQSSPGRSGFTIETAFKGIPRALRILPKFTVLSLLTKYSEWVEKGLPQDDDVDPGIWVPDYFRNWLISTIQLNWAQGDLNCNISAISAFGVDNEGIVPSWDQYIEYLKKQGAMTGYRDYIRGFGDLCWEDENGKPSCHSQCALVEDFVALYGARSTTAATSTSTSAGGCLNINSISASDLDSMRRMVLAESQGEGKVGMALVARAIMNRKMYIDTGKVRGGEWCTPNSPTLKQVIEAKCSNGVAQFSPVTDTRYNNDWSRYYKDADEAIAMAFDTAALKSSGIDDRMLTSDYFQTIGSGSGDSWTKSHPPGRHKNHHFARGKQTEPIWTPAEALKLFEEKYGKCEKATTTTTTTSAVSLLDCLKFEDIQPLLQRIIQAESASGGYDAVNIPNRGASTLSSALGKRYDQLTVKDIRINQEAGRIGASGRYQIILPTLRKILAATGIPESAKFDQATQNKMFMWLITGKRPEIGNYLAGRNDDLREAAQGVAREWAGIGLSYPEAPGPQLRDSGRQTSAQDDVKRPKDSSLYAGINGNKASVNSASIQAALRQSKQNVGNKCQAQTSTALKYKSTPQSTSKLWSANSRTDTPLKLAVAAGHWNTDAVRDYPRHGGARIHENMQNAPSGGVQWNGRMQIDERQFNKMILNALVSTARSRGITVEFLDPDTTTRSKTTRQVINWLSSKRAEGFYSFEIHNDQNSSAGRAGVIAGRQRWAADVNLANEFGYFSLNHRNGSLAVQSSNSAILEVYSMGDVNARPQSEWPAMVQEAVDRILRALYNK